ncbi:MAG: DUF2955 domain-containing protein, partial [Roseobacter sp.]
MPTDALTSNLPPPSAAAVPVAARSERIRNRRTLRLGMGVTITFLIALWFDWTLGYLAPAFAAPLLLAHTPPSLASTLRILAVTLAVMLAFYFVAGFARAYPGFFLLAMWPALYATLLYSERGGSSLIVLLILLGLMLLPMVAKISMEQSWIVGASSFWNIGVALLVTKAMFALFPPLSGPPKPAPKPRPSDAEAIRRARIMTIITGSYTMANFGFDWTNVHTPIYIAIFIQQVSLASGLKMTKGILAANVGAGFVGWGMYELFVMVPNLLFVALLTFTVVMLFARVITSSSALVPLASAALNVLMFLVGSAMISWSDTQADKFSDRLGEIGMAALYAIAALIVLEALFPRKPAT